ncbi:MAG: DNA methyltransferase [Candidatus Helarchaeota archaeon]
MASKKNETRGGYDPRNKLNDLTGKEWKFFSKSVFNKHYNKHCQFEKRKQHGGNKPPLMCMDLIRIFTKSGARILDPLMGVGGTLLGASLCEKNGRGRRTALGIEINPKWVEIYKEICSLEGLEEQETIIGDATNKLDEIKDDQFDFVLTDVPYWNMDKLEHTRGASNIQKGNVAASILQNFGSDKLTSKQEWLSTMKKVFEKTLLKLRHKGYCAVFVGDMYRGSQYHLLHAELARELVEAGYVLKANIVWYDVERRLHVYGYPYAYVPSMVHQNILILRKE